MVINIKTVNSDNNERHGSIELGTHIVPDPTHSIFKSILLSLSVLA